MHALYAVERRIGARAEVVRRAAPAEREAVVGRALAVDPHMAEVGERLAAA
jgi:hypothetical protein